MAEILQLTKPWLVAVWPGMGHVAVSAGYYLMAKLGVHMLAEMTARELFDIEQVIVKEGLIQKPRMPRNRFFLWMDPEKKHDLLIFIGEAQPPLGRYPFCQKIIEYAQQLGVERVFTFAAMATQMHPEQPSRVFVATTDRHSLEELKDRNVELLEDGHISGLNGVLLGAAAEAGLRGTCLLGEMPHIFTQLPFPQGSLAVLKVFTAMTHVEIDLEELTEQAEAVGKQLGQLLEQAQMAIQEQLGGADDDEEDQFLSEEPAEEERGGVSAAERERIDQLFEQARENRKKAYELKRELDRLQVFDEYEDRFLDLFKHGPRP